MVFGKSCSAEYAPHAVLFAHTVLKANHSKADANLLGLQPTIQIQLFELLARFGARNPQYPLLLEIQRLSLTQYLKAQDVQESQTADDDDAILAMDPGTEETLFRQT